MRNALEVLAEMEAWWHSNSSQPHTPEQAIHVGITWLYNRTYPDLAAMELESSKLAHFRSLFTVWKAVCARLKLTRDYPVHGSQQVTKVPVYPFADTSVDALKAFPGWLERQYPDFFPVLLQNRVFLGVTFTPAEQARHQQLVQEYLRHKEPLSQAGRRQAKQMMTRRL